MTDGPPIGLRQRQTPIMSTSSSEKRPLVQRYQRAAPPPRRPTRSLHLALTILILGFFVLFTQRGGPKKAKRVYGAGHRALPSMYGICTKDRQGIYTVPAESGVGAVECVVVSGKEVADTGSLSKPCSENGVHTWLMLRRQDTETVGRQSNYRRG